MQLDVLRRRAEKIPNKSRSPNVLDDEFRLAPGMNFTCNGTITNLLLGVDVRTMTASRVRYPEVQIWRRNQLDDSYSRQDRQEIRLAAGDFSPDGVLVYNLTPPMQFQSGDVLGVYQPLQSASVVRLYYNVNDSAPGAIRIKSATPSSLSLSGSLQTVIGQQILLFPVTGQRVVMLLYFDLFSVLPHRPTLH